MAMHRMQNMQFLSDSGEECCKFFADALKALAQFMLTSFIVSERCLCSDIFTAGCCLLVLCRLHVISCVSYSFLCVCGSRTRCSSATPVTGVSIWSVVTHRSPECQKVH